MRLFSLVRVFLLAALAFAPTALLADSKQLVVLIQGTQFTLELTQNTLLKKVEIIHLPAVEESAYFFEGKVKNVPNSWVRASLVNNQWAGIISASSALYQFNFHAAAAKQVTTEDNADSEEKNFPPEQSAFPIEKKKINSLFTHGSFIDAIPLTQNSGGNGTVAVRSADIVGVKRTVAASSSVGNELVRLDLELFLDHYFIDYATSLGLTPTTTAMQMANIVDGIYRADLGIRLNLAGISSDTNGASPILSETNNADQLLNDMESKKNANQLFSQGDAKIGHLITSRSRDDGLSQGGSSGIVGLSFSRGTINEAPVLCSSSTLGLSLAYLPDNSGASDLAPLTALTMAHEIAHNLGAIHDGTVATGYTTNTCDPNNYIMSAHENSATHFSSCTKQEVYNELVRVRKSISLGQVQNCLTDLVDLDVSASNSYLAYQSVNARNTREVTLINRSDVGASQIVFTGTLSNSSAKYIGVSAPDASCNLITDYSYSCTLPTLAANSQVAVSEQIEYSEINTVDISTQISSFTSSVGAQDIDAEDVATSSVSIIDLQLPVAPSAVQAVRVDSGVKIDWKDNSDSEDYFSVQRKTNNGDFVSLTSTIPANTTTYIDSTATDTQASYVYRVAAINRVGDSSQVESPTVEAVKHSHKGGGVINVFFVSVLMSLLFRLRRN